MIPAKLTLSHIALLTIFLVPQVSRAGVVISFDGVRHRDGLGHFDQVTYSMVRVADDANGQWLLEQPGTLLNPRVQLSPNSKLIAVLKDGVLAVFTNDARAIQRLHRNESVHSFKLEKPTGANYWRANQQTPDFRWVSDNELAIVTHEARNKDNFQCRLLVGLDSPKAIVCHFGFQKAALWRDGQEVPMVIVDADFLSSVLLSRIAPFQPTEWRAFFWDHPDKDYLDMWNSKTTQQMRGLTLEQLEGSSQATSLDSRLRSDEKPIPAKP
jgi:hypothetical protein